MPKEKPLSKQKVRFHAKQAKLQRHASQPASPLPRPPAELRNRIFELALSDFSGGLRIRWTTGQSKNNKNKPLSITGAGSLANQIK